MKTKLQLLVEQRADARASAGAIIDLAKKEDRGFTDEEQADVDNHMAVSEQAENDHAALLHRQKAAETLSGGDQWGSQGAGRVGVLPQPGQSAAGIEPPPAEPERFDTFGHMLQAVATASRTDGRVVDPRLMNGPQAAVTGLSEGVASDGGFLVGTDVSSDLMKQTFETGVLAQRCSRTPISNNSNGLKINGVDETSRAAGSQWGGVTAFWEEEGADKTSSTPKFRQISLNLHKLIGLLPATDELLQDASALESIIMEAFPNVFGFYVDDAIIRGTGAGLPKGILTGAVNAPRVRVVKEVGQAATTLVAENIEKMWARMWSRGMSNAAFFINQDVWPQIFQLHHVVGTGGVPMFIPAGGLSQSPFGTLLGRPIIPIEQCSTLGTEGDIIFADFSQYKLIEKGGIQTASSIHVRFVNDETMFRFVMRVDGQSMWASSLTPAQGTNTVTPFVTLATRS